MPIVLLGEILLIFKASFFANPPGHLQLLFRDCSEGRRRPLYRGGAGGPRQHQPRQGHEGEVPAGEMIERGKKRRETVDRKN